MSVASLAFPYVESEGSSIHLNKFILTDESDEYRYLVGLSENEQERTKSQENGHSKEISSKLVRLCSSIVKIKTDTQAATGDLITYIQNPTYSIDNITVSPLLISTPASFNKFKLNVSIKTASLTPSTTQTTLIIIKSIGNSYDVNSLKQYLDSKLSTNNALRIEISRLPYSNFPVAKKIALDYQKIIVNDSFNVSLFQDNMINISIWEEVTHNDINTYNHFFSFDFWVKEEHPKSITSPLPQASAPLLPSEADLMYPNSSSNSKSFSLSADNLPPSVKDSPPIPIPIPYPMPVPSANDTHSVLTSATSMMTGTTSELGSKSLSVVAIRKAFAFNLEDGPDFRRSLNSYEKNIPIFKKHCLILLEEISKISATTDRLMASKHRVLEAISALADCQAFRPLLHDLNFKNEFQNNFLKIFQSFETELKNFLVNVCDYKTIQKVLGMATTQDPNVLVNLANASHAASQAEASKKQFEKNSKDYYHWLNKYLSNETERPELKLLVKRKQFEISKFDYLNSLNLSTNNQYFSKLLENLFRFNSAEIPLKYDIYLNVVSKFNSEKLLLRQSIEACKTNEELTNIIRTNTLTKLSSTLYPQRVTSLGAIDSVFFNESTIVNAIPSKSTERDQNSEMAGILFALGGQGRQGWHKEWVVLKKGQLVEYSDWRQGKVAVRAPIEIALSNVKQTTNEKRKFCFEILTSRGSKHVFQALNAEERDQWLKALFNAGQLVNTSRLAPPISKSQLHLQPNALPPQNSTHRTMADNRNFLSKLDVKAPKFSTDGFESPVSTLARSPIFKNGEEVDYIMLVRSKPENLNHSCADCGLYEAVEWVSLSFLTIFCLQCSSGHRALGTHISRIRSLKLDNFSDESEVLINNVNNKKANSYLEENLPLGAKITQHSSPEERSKFIQRKYLTKEFVLKFEIHEGLLDALVRSIQKVDISETVKYISCGANINAKISLNINKTEFIKVSLLEYSLRKFIELNDPPRRIFAISELLVLNGCKIEPLSDRKEIHLSPEAIDYWNQRSKKLLGD